jgi:hypothetical protein
MVWIAEHLRLFSNAGEGLVRQIKHNVRGHGTYLLGRVADRSIWYYFPVALTIKLCVPVLLLPMVLAVTRPRSLVNWACLAALGLLAFSVTCRVQIGIRLVLPLVALALVGLAAAVIRSVAAVQERGIRLQSFGRALAYAPALFALAAVLWGSVAAVRVWPNGLCYTNELWGGTRQGYLALSDSNYDWGQGLKELARWQQQRGRPPLAVWYFGTDPVLQKLPVKELRFHTLPIASPDDVRERVRGRYVAVSTTLLYGSLGTVVRSGPPQEARAFAQTMAFLHEYQPVSRTSTFLIYDFTHLH